MRYSPAGLCLNDFALLGDGPYRLMHLQGPWTPEFDAARMETSYGLASSDDLVTWQPAGPCFGVGRPGSFDESAVWTMHPFSHNGGHVMLYTGVSTPGYARQRIGLAYSDRSDGAGWRRVTAAPVCSPDPRWYVTGPGEAWRDPWVVDGRELGARYAMLVAAQAGDATPGKAGCVGLAVSDELERWQPQPALLVPGDVDELECPVLEPTGDGWLLLVSISPARRIEAWRSTRLTGPWERLGPIAPAGPYAPRLVTGPDGQRLLLHTVPRRVGLTDDGAWCRGMLAQPKVFTIEDGRPQLRWWGALAGYLGPATDPGAELRDAVLELEELELPCHVTLRGGGVTLTVTEGTMQLSSETGHPLQAALLPTAPERVRVLMFGEHLEVYADEVLTLSTVSYASDTGSARVITGRASLSARPARHSDTRDDASALWPGPVRAR